MGMRRLPFLALGLGLAMTTLSGAAPLTGLVFNDANGNGVRDSGEAGLAGIEVSNGETVVRTDSNGAYAIDPGPEPVFVVKPSGWALAEDARHLTKFYNASGGDFALAKAEEPAAFKVLVFTDTQPADPKELGYFEKTLVTPRAGKSGCAFGVTLGDLVYDRPDLFGGIQDAVAQIGIPWHHVPGNHDINVLAGSEQDAVAAYEGAFGPSTYAFRYAHATFLALDDVRPRGGPRYVGGFMPSQLSFLGAVIHDTPADDLIVLLLHIPLFPDPPGAESFRWPDRQKLFDLLKGHSHVLILSGHTHLQRHVFHGSEDGWTGAEPIHEYNVAAACGGFWGGVANAAGLPPATMWDGTPPGCGLVSINGTDVKLDYLPSEFPATHQIGLYVPKVLAPHLGYVGAYANVFNGHKGWKVEARVDEHAWGPMAPNLGWDPSYAAAFLAQDSGPLPALGKRLPDPVLCFHLYRCYLPPDLDPGLHHFEVRATDPSGTVYVEQEEFQVGAAKPAGAPSSIVKVNGIGGFFFRSPNPDALAKWYNDHLGVNPIPTDYHAQPWVQEKGPTAFAPFPPDDKYIGKPDHAFMLNFRVADLDAMVDQLRKAGIEVKVDPTPYPNGRFAHLKDPDGTRVELWQPLP